MNSLAWSSQAQITHHNPVHYLLMRGIVREKHVRRVSLVSIDNLVQLQVHRYVQGNHYIDSWPVTLSVGESLVRLYRSKS